MRYLSLWIVMLLFPVAAAAASASDTVNFDRDVKPIFDRYCVSCHGPERDEAFRIDLEEELLWHVEPHDSENSAMYFRLTTDDETMLMPPPEEGRPLTDQQIETIRRWIDEGASTEPPPLADDLQPEDEEAVERQVREAESFGERLWKALGALHPITVHFPIGLLIVAALFALFSLRGNYVMSDCAYYCLVIGALMAVVSSVLGWSFAPLKLYTDDIFDRDSAIFWHRWTGIAATVLAVIVALMATISRRRDPENGVLWKLGLFVVAILIGFSAHQGGKLTHPGTYNRLIDLLGIAAEPDPRQPRVAPDAEAPPAADPAEAPQAEPGPDPLEQNAI